MSDPRPVAGGVIGVAEITMHTVHGEPAGDEPTIGVINIVDALARGVMEPGVGLKVLDVVTVENVASVRAGEARARRRRIVVEGVQLVGRAGQGQSGELRYSEGVGVFRWWMGFVKGWF